MKNTNPYAVLGLPTGADTDAARSAFRRVAMACHPDRAPGDADARGRFEEARAAYSRILAARRAMERMEVLRAAPQSSPKFTTSNPAAMGPKKPVVTSFIDLELTLKEAVFGGMKRVRGPNGSVTVRIPKGAREGDRLRGGDLLVFTVKIATPDSFHANGNDIFGSVSISAAIAISGGRTEVETPHGRLRVTIPANVPHGARLRLVGRGLPERGNRPTGDLFLTINHALAQKGMLARWLDGFRRPASDASRAAA